MDLPSVLPPPPHLDPDIARANRILANAYHAARSILSLAQPDINQVRYHQERVWTELVPLLDVILESTSDTAMRSWCCGVTKIIANLFNQLTQCEASAHRRFAVLSPLMAAMDVDKYLTVKGYLLLPFTRSLPNNIHSKNRGIHARSLTKLIYGKQHTHHGTFQKRDSRESLGSTEILSRRSWTGSGYTPSIPQLGVVISMHWSRHTRLRSLV